VHGVLAGQTTHQRGNPMDSPAPALAVESIPHASPNATPTAAIDNGHDIPKYLGLEAVDGNGGQCRKVGGGVAGGALDNSLGFPT